MDAKSDEMVVKERWPDAFEHSSGTIWSHRGWNTNYSLGDNWAAARRYAEPIGSKLKVEDGATNETKRCRCGSEVCVGADHIRVGVYCARLGESGKAVAPYPAVEAESVNSEQPTISLLYKKASIMPDGSLGCVSIGEFAGDRSKDLHLTVGQARTLATQIQERIGK